MGTDNKIEIAGEISRIKFVHIERIDESEESVELESLCDKEPTEDETSSSAK